jgi:hypothetical protein
VREFDVSGRKPDAVSVVFGIIQTALYIDFAWVYYTRQRVKLRGGGVVDADDMRRAWFLQRIFGRTVGNVEDEESGPGEHGHDNDNRRGGSRPKWGARGISVSADDGVMGNEGRHEPQTEGFEDADPDAKMRDPDDLAKALDDDDDEDTPLRPGQSSQTPADIRDGEEWRD